MLLEQLRFLKSYMSAQRNAALIPCARAVPVDTGLDGTARFAYSLGDAPAILAGNKVFTATDGVIAGSTVLVTEDQVPEDYTGCILVIGGEEHVLVVSQATIDDGTTSTTTFELANPIQRSRVAGQVVDVTAFLVQTVNGTEYPLGTTTLSVQTDNILVPGDQLALLLNTSVTPTLSQYLEITGVVKQDSQGSQQYLITLARPLPYDVTAGVQLYVRAQPAYKSEVLPVTVQTTFACLDVNGGETQGKGAMTATISAVVRDAGHQVLRTVTGPINTVIRLGNLSVAEMACFPVDRGSLGVVSNCLRVKLDATGCFGFGIHLPQALDFGSQLDLESETGFQLCIETDASKSWQQIPAQTSTVISITGETRKLILRITGAPNQIVWVREHEQPRCHSLEYSIVVDLHENEMFQATGLLVKPLLPSLASCEPDNCVLETNRGVVIC